MREEVEKVIQKADELSDQVNRLLFYMEDDPKTGQKGFISRLYYVEQQLDKLDQERSYQRGEKAAKIAIYTGIGLAVTWILTNVGNFIDFVFSLTNKGD